VPVTLLLARYRIAMMLSVLTAGVAQGQVPVTATPPAPDTLASFERPNGAILRAGTLVYQLSLAKSTGGVTSLGTRTVVVSESSLAGSAGWLIAEARRGTAVETTDSVSLARADLAPQRWMATMGTAQLGASFTHDSAFGAISTYQGRASFVIAVPPDALLSGGMVERIIEMLPLRVGYRAAATLVLVPGATPQLVRAEIDVDREATIDVAGRPIDCWVVALRAGAIEERLWVSKNASRVMRVEQALADGVLVSMLQQ
jgi:hypothetical protein